jgi:DNA gyrase subunit A
MSEDKNNLYAMNEKVIPVPIEDEMRNSYIDYAMSVIVGRALPDVRDGLKPVHRRILYAMNDLGLASNKPYRKSARIVGEVLGKYHPHGDNSVYDSIVRMVQTFSLRYPLIDGQGNFGSIDGDNAAAMRYTEIRMEKVSHDLINDIEKETVSFVPNFDDSLLEPSVLPAAIPNLLVNGSSGIAVGMATNIPPHNMGEVIRAITALIDNPEITIAEIGKIIKGPDFPTGGIIMGREGLKSAQETGRGRVVVRAKAAIEEYKNGRSAIVISELPYQVNKTTLIESIVRLVEAKKIEGISDIRDESDRKGMRLMIELKKDAIGQVILNQLYKHTQMQDTFGIIMLALVDGQPRVLNIKQALQAFVDFRFEIVTRRTKFDLTKAEKRAHILEGLKIAISNVDKVIKIIRGSKNPEEAKETLMSQLKLSEIQAKAILEMQLQRLTQLEQHKIDEEYAEILKRIEYFQSLLNDRKKMFGLIKKETIEIGEKYQDERRTQIAASEEEIDIEDLIVEEDVVITMSFAGYIKRIPVSMYRKQRRGGSGVTGSGLRDDDDFIEHMFLSSTHETIMFFTNTGRVYWRKAYQIPQASRIARGKAIVNLLSLRPDEKVTNFLRVKEYDEDHSLVMVTKKGVIKRTNLMSYSRPRSNGINAINLRDGDELVGCVLVGKGDQLFMASRSGKAIRFKESDIRDMGRTATGVRGMRIDDDDEVIAAQVVQEGGTALSVTENGYGKKSQFKDYRLQTRGGKGVINVKVTPKNGQVVSVVTVQEEDELIIVTSGGMIVRCPVNQIRTSGRNAQGVRVIRLKENHKVAAVTRVVEKEDGDGEDQAEFDLLEDDIETEEK